MNSYYLTLVLKPDVDEKERKTLLDLMVKKLVGDPSTLQPRTSAVSSVPNGSGRASSGQVGKVLKEDLWGARDLAYPIKRQTKGFYAHFEIEADPKGAKGLDKTLKLEEDILRYLLIRV